ncbi:MAG TPA: dihydrolipoyl dehydrogenase [Burkholderiales bacterium]|nr:dihydrolipoyl dehydrogenase [Burkholderiales bacterium]
MSDQSFDVVVIGSGPAGYICAIRAAQLGFKTACVEAWRNPAGKPVLGGTCLNVGCIPSKALLQSSEEYDHVNKGLALHGIEVSGASIDVPKMIARKDAIVSKMTGGIEFLFRKNKVSWLQGHGRLVKHSEQGWQLDVAGKAVQAKHVVIATGSKPRTLPGVEIDNELVCDNVGALDFKTVPQKLGVIGAGVIGLELGSVWRRLGAAVTVLEALPEFLPAADESVSREAWKIFTKEQGLDIRLGVKLGEVRRGKNNVSVVCEHDGRRETLEFDKLIVAIGRVPNTDGLGAEGVGLQCDARGFIEVDSHCATSLPNLYAIGDVVRGPMLAHKGQEEGVMVAERIAGQKPLVDLETIPWVIYTAPEIAWVGQTEQQLKAEGIPYRAGQFPFSVNGRALCAGDPRGFVKMLAHRKTDEILGVHIINTHASELIAEAVVAMEFHSTAEDIARIVHAHPSLTEALHEAALAVDKRALNI